LEELTVRLMRDSDIDFALSLTTMEEWSDIRSDFVSLISYRPAAAFIAELNGQSVSMISAVSYGAVGFIGSLIVLPSYRNQGIGTALMKHAIQCLENNGAEAVMLDAVQKAVAVYERLGFKRVCLSRRFRGLLEGASNGRVEQMTEQLLPSVLALDKQSFGGDRSHFLNGTLRANPDLCVVLERERRVSAYAFASRRNNIVRLAPLFARSPEDAEVLVRELAGRSLGRQLKLGILDTNTEAVSLARRLGLLEDESSVRMLRSSRKPISMSNLFYAIGSPAKG